MAHIFLSYASEDRERVRPLVERLEAYGWEGRHHEGTPIRTVEVACVHQDSDAVAIGIRRSENQGRVPLPDVDVDDREFVRGEWLRRGRLR